MPSNIEEWTIHGLWPERVDASWPSCCNPKDTFQISELSSIMSELLVAWYDAFTPSNSTGLWNHEWDKHGTCAISDADLGSELLYFSTAIRLHHLLNVTVALDAAGITPSTSKSYVLTDILAAMSKATDYEPVITCVSTSGKSVMQELYFCISPELSPMECNDAIRESLEKEGECDTDVYYYPISH